MVECSMTNTFPVESECSLCGARSEQHLIAGVTTQGLPDLDTRPAEPVRATIFYWVQRCPNCGYCATDISLEYPLADQTVHSEAYEKILRKRLMPEKARQFLAWGLIQELNEESGGAGWAAVHAAWVCDDADEKAPSALECRKLALERFARQRARQGHITGFEDPGVEELVLSDLSRRTGQFASALRWVEAGLERKPSLMVARALRTERELAQSKDLVAHSVEELLDKAD
jgi:hypothetical protein